MISKKLWGNKRKAKYKLLAQPIGILLRHLFNSSLIFLISNFNRSSCSLYSGVCIYAFILSLSIWALYSSSLNGLLNRVKCSGIRTFPHIVDEVGVYFLFEMVLYFTLYDRLCRFIEITPKHT